MDSLATALFGASRDIRYVARYRSGDLQMRSRSDLPGASGDESDRYEELIVNPTLLTLARQRGDIDCGGLEYLLLRYGSFFALVHPIDGGHVTVGIETHADPLALLGSIRAILGARGFLAAAA